MSRPERQNVLALNVGGTHYTTTLSTLLSQDKSYFTSLLSGDWAETGQNELFIDRDGELFKHILRYLRASPEGQSQLVQTLPKSEQVLLAEEARFFQLHHLNTLLETEEPASQEYHYFHCPATQLQTRISAGAFQGCRISGSTFVFNPNNGDNFFHAVLMRR